MIVLDTHVLLWWTLDPAKLSRKASGLCSEITKTGCLISSISIWELGIKIKKGALDIGMTIDEFTRKIRTLNSVEIVPVDENIWIKSLQLDWDHRDPADRVIVATAESREASIVSMDEKIRSFYRDTIW